MEAAFRARPHQILDVSRNTDIYRKHFTGSNALLWIVDMKPVPFTAGWNYLSLPDITQ